MSDPAATDAIDVVFTWVDGVKNAALRARYAGDAGAPEEAQRNAGNRFRDNGELLQAIASVRAFAPFVRRIFVLVAPGQVPEWYDAHAFPEVHIVTHDAVFRDAHADFLPTFNSHAIEAMVPFIPDLSERFVYFNDDMFLGAPVTPEDFFDADGRAVVRYHEIVAPHWRMHKKVWRVYRGNLLEHWRRRYSGVALYDTAHQGRTLRKSSCWDTWDDPYWRDVLLDTVRDRFRARTNIPPIELFANMALRQGKARPVRDPGEVLQVFDASVLGPEFRAINLLRPTFFCINDDMVNPTDRHLAAFRRLLASRLPHHRLAASGRVPPPRPRLGAAVREVAHAVSWCNRMVHRLVRRGR